MVSRASTRARWGLAAAAVVAAVFLGAAILNNGGTGPGIGSAPATASPLPSPTPARAPTLSPTPRPPTTLSSAPHAACDPGGGAPDCLEAGTYSLSSSGWPGRVTLDVPAGWFQYRPAADFDGVLVDGGPDALGGSGWGVMFAAVGAVSHDPCDQSLGTIDPTRTSTADGLVTAMSRWPGFEATAPTPIVVDGFSGQLIELTTPRTSKSCPLQMLWTTPEGWRVDGYPIVNPTGTRHTNRSGSWTSTGPCSSSGRPTSPRRRRTKRSRAWRPTPPATRTTRSRSTRSSTRSRSPSPHNGRSRRRRLRVSAPAGASTRRDSAERDRTQTDRARAR